MKNLLLVSQMLDNNLKVEFDILKGEKIFFVPEKSRQCQIKVKGVRRMFMLAVVASKNQYLNVCVTNVTTLWNSIFIHMNSKYIITLQKKDILCGLPYLISPTNVYSTCITGKQSKLPFVANTHQVKGPLDVIHIDLCKPMSVNNTSQRYFLFFVDVYSRKIWMFFLKIKDENF